MECVLRKFGTYENFEEVTGGSVLPKSRVWATVRKYLQKEGCVGEVCVFGHPHILCIPAWLTSTEQIKSLCVIFAGGGVSVWWAPVSSCDDGGELQTNFNHKLVWSTAALAGRDAKTRDRYDQLCKLRAIISRAPTCNSGFILHLNIMSSIKWLL